jgi:hypothetical protein
VFGISLNKGYYHPDGARTFNWFSNGTYTGTLGTAVFSRSIKGIGTYLIKKAGIRLD